MSERCRSCSAPIRWVYTAKGRRIPLDPKPTRDGNIVLRGIGPIAQIIPGHGPADPPLYISHFATCPYAAAHRSRL